MDCKEITYKLYEYIDRELGPDEVVEVEKHLHHCPECFELVRFESGVIKLVRRDCCKDQAPDALLRKIVSILRS